MTSIADWLASFPAGPTKATFPGSGLAWRMEERAFIGGAAERRPSWRDAP